MAFFDLLRGGSRFERAVEKYQPAVAVINEQSQALKALSDGELKERLLRLRGRALAELRELAPHIFAVVREASERALKMRPFDVQLLGGFALLDGMIAEMKTGEGKTLVATLPLTLHALAGGGAHLVTVNDYLAQRDAAWMGPLYSFFGLTVGVVVPGMSPAEKRAAYAGDITYGTNNEFGFDYLRDNMAQQPGDLVQRELVYAIVDEVDSILIDEARTPLIISAPDAESTQLYQQFARLVPQLKRETDYNVDEKRRAVTLTDEGVSRVESALGVENIYADKGVRFVHHLEQALRAHALYKRDKDYVVKDGEVIIVDEFTGRLMHGRRYSEGLHQAIEAKEGVRVQQESRTLATITFQNFFRLYATLAGMTGTAVTSAEEFEKVYNLDVAVVPTNRPLVRHDRPDKIFVHERAKFQAVVHEIKARHVQGQPVLVGTIAIEKSEYLSQLLQREGIAHEVLNAKHHAREAEIIAKAGQEGAVTISTNMAGRGTDIKLGAGVAELGGLFVLGTERHEARRIDNQLRGRSGRQGDPGETQFFVSMEDDVMRIFGGTRIKGLMERLRLPDDEPIENKLVTKAISGAQERVEGYYFDIRKQLLAYDDVLNRQRTAIYTLRRGLLREGVWRDTAGEADLHERAAELLTDYAKLLVSLHASGEAAPGWNIQEIVENIHALTGLEAPQFAPSLQAAVAVGEAEGPAAARERLAGAVQTVLAEQFNEREQRFGLPSLRALERAASLSAIDVHWMDHLDTMDYLRTGIGLRGYGQRDPLVEYQKEGYMLFQGLMDNIRTSLLETVFRAEPAFGARAGAAVPAELQVSGGQEGSGLHQLAQAAPAASASEPVSAAQPESALAARRATAPLRNQYKGVGRNDPCPCGSGKKFKRCHGR